MQRLSRGVHVKLGLFATVALVSTSILGAGYVGFDPFSDKAVVTVSLPDAGGLFVNSEVTYRGVQVGEVTDLTPTAEGVDVTVELDADAPDIPADSSVRVRNRSAIGEQYLDLRGEDPARGGDGAGGGDAAVLADGDRLRGSAEGLPPDLAEVLRSGRDFVASVPSDDLTTVIDEGYDLSRGIGDDLTRLLDTSTAFQEAADDNFLVTASLIRNSRRVLQTQGESAGALKSYSRDLRRLAATLADSDADLRTLVRATPGAAREVDLLVRDVGAPLTLLMSNLTSTATIVGVNADGVRDALVHLPEAVSIGYGVTGGRGLDLGLVPTFFSPLPCTEGYGSTTTRPGTDTTPGRPFNTRAGCTAPRSEGNVRGPQAVAGGYDGADAVGPLGTVDTVDGLADLMGGTR